MFHQACCSLGRHNYLVCENNKKIRPNIEHFRADVIIFFARTTNSFARIFANLPSAVSARCRPGRWVSVDTSVSCAHRWQCSLVTVSPRPASCVDHWSVVSVVLIINFELLLHDTTFDRYIATANNNNNQPWWRSSHQTTTTDDNNNNNIDDEDEDNYYVIEACRYRRHAVVLLASNKFEKRKELSSLAISEQRGYDRCWNWQSDDSHHHNTPDELVGQIIIEFGCCLSPSSISLTCSSKQLDRINTSQIVFGFI